MGPNTARSVRRMEGVLVPTSSIQGGAVTVRYNGVKISPTTSSGAYKLVSTGGPGEIDVEFTVNPSAPLISAYVRKAYLVVNLSFARCLEKNVCLKTLGSVVGGQGQEFRTFNTEQLACLEGERKETACKLWLQCLSSDSKSRLRTLLLAAGVGNRSVLVRAAARVSKAMNTSNSTNTSKRWPVLHFSSGAAWPGIRSLLSWWVGGYATDMSD